MDIKINPQLFPAYTLFHSAVPVYCLTQGSGMRFIEFDYDGTFRRELMEVVLGSGHPSLHPSGRYLITDAYPAEKEVAYPDGSVAIRLADLENKTIDEIIRMPVETGLEPNLRLDPHPVWCANGNLIVFNGFADGTRRIYCAEYSSTK